jgi:hypothetical protein
MPLLAVGAKWQAKRTQMQESVKRPAQTEKRKETTCQYQSIDNAADLRRTNALANLCTKKGAEA